MDELKINFIGGGNMAKSLIKGLTSDELLSTSISVIDTDILARKTLCDMGVNAVEDAGMLGAAEIIVLAVKPQNMEEALTGVRVDNALVISVAAGVKIKTLTRLLKGHKKIIRAMPNLPALIGSGVTAVYAEQEITSTDRSLAAMVLKGIGESFWVLKEDHIDVATALSGSGPAYVFYIMEVMEKIALDMGLEKDTARNLVIGTLRGSSQLASVSEDSPNTLRKKVTSKAGTTERALNTLSAGRLDDIFKEAITAAYLRAVEIGEANDK